MKAAILESNQRKVRIVELPDRKPGQFQAKLQIRACGVCGSDVHLIAHGTMKCKHYPMTPGHEASGIVVELGEGCNKVSVGDRVVISAGTSCGVCNFCLSGRENLCPEIGVFGFDRDGSFAEHLIVEERYLHKLPDSIPFEQGAILADAVSTPFHAIHKRGNLTDGETVAIIGCGGLGIHGVAVARALTKGKIIAVDIDSGALDNAVAYGADEAINLKSTKNIGKTLKELSRGIDLLADFSGYSQNVQESVRAMNRGGRIVLVGIGRNPLQFSVPFFLIERMITVTGSYGSDSNAIPSLIQLMQQGKLNLEKSITSTHPLEELNDCIQTLEERKGNPIRMVIQPNGKN